jgi:hypothetical protein
MTILPGARISFLVAYKVGVKLENNLAVRVYVDNPNISLVPDSTYIFNSSFPNGTPDTSNHVDSNGITVGNYSPHAGGYVRLILQLGSSFGCGTTRASLEAQVWAERSNDIVSSVPLSVAGPCPS